MICVTIFYKSSILYSFFSVLPRLLFQLFYFCFFGIIYNMFYIIVTNERPNKIKYRRKIVLMFSRQIIEMKVLPPFCWCCGKIKPRGKVA